MAEPHVERPYMPDYGVPLDPDGLLPWAWGRERLVRSRNYWITTVAPDGIPHSTPLWGLWDSADDTYTFSCGPTARKRRNLERNPNITIAADDTVEVVSITGTADIVTDTPDAFYVGYLDKYAESPENRDEMGAFIRSMGFTVRVTPRIGFGMIERAEDFSRCATRWRWE
jgi:PPOX class probable F420-dependent enzyme